MPTDATNGVETYYERRGSGPPVVLVHGAILDHSQWGPQVEALAEDYEVITYDVRGHGRTGGSAAGTYSVELFATDLRALVDALGLDRPVVCGLSLGGCIAQVHAAAHPDEVSGLVLADTFAPELRGRGEWVQRSLLLRATVPFVRVVGYERVERALVWLQQRLHGEGVSGDYAEVEALRASETRMTTGEFAKVVRAIAAFYETTVEFGAITAPTLVLYGEHEPPFVRRHAAAFATEIPDATVTEIPGAGHASNLDNPECFTAELRAFLDGVCA